MRDKSSVSKLEKSEEEDEGIKELFLSFLLFSSLSFYLTLKSDGCNKDSDQVLNLFHENYHDHTTLRRD